MTFKYKDLTRKFMETISISEIFSGKRLSNFLSRKLKRKISILKAARLLDGAEECIPFGKDNRGRRQWKRIL